MPSISISRAHRKNSAKRRQSQAVRNPIPVKWVMPSGSFMFGTGAGALIVRSGAIDAGFRTVGWLKEETGRVPGHSKSAIDSAAVALVRWKDTAAEAAWNCVPTAKFAAANTAVHDYAHHASAFASALGAHAHAVGISTLVLAQLLVQLALVASLAVLAGTILFYIFKHRRAIPPAVVATAFAAWNLSAFFWEAFTAIWMVCLHAGVRVCALVGDVERQGAQDFRRRHVESKTKARAQARARFGDQWEVLQAASGPEEIRFEDIPWPFFGPPFASSRSTTADPGFEDLDKFLGPPRGSDERVAVLESLKVRYGEEFARVVGRLPGKAERERSRAQRWSKVVAAYADHKARELSMEV